MDLHLNTFLNSLNLRLHLDIYNLRSSSERLLEQPRIKTLVTLGDRSFEVAAPTLWNSLPVEVRNASNVQLFKRMLKTWFSRKAFCSIVL